MDEKPRATTTVPVRNFILYGQETDLGVPVGRLWNKLVAPGVVVAGTTELVVITGRSVHKIWILSTVLLAGSVHKNMHFIIGVVNLKACGNICICYQRTRIYH